MLIVYVEKRPREGWWFKVAQLYSVTAGLGRWLLRSLSSSVVCVNSAYNGPTAFPERDISLETLLPQLCGWGDCWALGFFIFFSIARSKGPLVFCGHRPPRKVIRAREQSQSWSEVTWV